MTHADSPLTPAQALGRLADLSSRQHSVEALLQAVADLSKAVLPGATEASVTVTSGADAVTVVSTGRLALDLDEAQYAHDQGPCLHAAATGELTEVPDSRTESRWPQYMTQAVEQGALSSLSVPLVVDDDGVSGALNIYSRQPHAFDPEARTLAARFAPYAATALADMRDALTATARAADLRTALEQRALVAQATGVVMERRALTSAEAVRVLAALADRTGSPLPTVAAAVVDAGRLPG